MLTSKEGDLTTHTNFANTVRYSPDDYLPISPHISPYLPISPHIVRMLAGEQAADEGELLLDS